MGLEPKMELPLRHVVVVYEIREGDPAPRLACEFRADGHVTLRGPESCGVALPLLIGAVQKCAAGLLRGELSRATTEGTEPTEGMRDGGGESDHDGGALGTTCPTDGEARRVVFLDVDGVLNVRLGSLDEDKLQRLKWLVAITGAHVVVSSSWRHSEEQVLRLTRALREIGIVPIGWTPDLSQQGEGGLWESKPRWMEIRAWLEAHPSVDQWVILDDLADMWPFNDRFVRVDGQVGLTNDDVMLALGTLTRQAILVGDVLPGAGRAGEGAQGIPTMEGGAA